VAKLNLNDLRGLGLDKEEVSKTSSSAASFVLGIIILAIVLGVGLVGAVIFFLIRWGMSLG
jgi:hypothetical protein